LYSLSDQTIEVTYGETVNGEFRVPSVGQLEIEIIGETDAVDGWGATTRDGPGGFDGVARDGSHIVGQRTMWWDTAPVPEAPQHFPFSIRTYRGSTRTFKVLFHWYRRDEEHCCLQHEVATLEIDVEPLPCELTGRDRATPELRLAASGSDGHIELRLPCCPNCGAAPVCPPGDTSQWFVAFPPDVHDSSMAGKPIPDGHGRGWRLAGTTLWSPGTDGLGYVFTTTP